jgi:hypothetical protein
VRAELEVHHSSAHRDLRAEGALIHGSIINLTVSGDRVRFEVSLDAAAESQLKLNSRLLAVAQAIQESRQQPQWRAAAILASLAAC